MKHNPHILAPAALILSILQLQLLTPTLYAAVPLRWTVETSRVQPAVFEAYQGETLTFEVALQSHGRALEAPVDYGFYWQTNGMGNAYWSTNVASAANYPAFAGTNVMFATWLPSMDVGARAYNCFIGAPGSNYHAAFQLRLRASPGAVPNVIEQPPPVLDLAHTAVINPPWPTDQTIDARIRQVIADDDITANVPTGMVRTVVSNTVTKAYVESLGISGGGSSIDTNAVIDIATSVVAPAVNAAVNTGRAITASAAADGTNYTDTAVGQLSSQLSQLSQQKADKSTVYTKEESDEMLTRKRDVKNLGVLGNADDPKRGIVEWERQDLWGGTLTWSDERGSWYGILYDPYGEYEIVPGHTPIGSDDMSFFLYKNGELVASGYNCLEIGDFRAVTVDRLAKVSDIPAEVEVIDPASATSTGKAADALKTRQSLAAKADSADLAPIRTAANDALSYGRGVFMYLNGTTNCYFSGTNYVIGAESTNRTAFALEEGMDLATVPCSMALWEIRDGTRQCVWDQRDWTVWYWNFKIEQYRSEHDGRDAALRALIARRCPLNWSSYTACGLTNAAGDTTWIDTPKVVLAAGYAWQHQLTVDGVGYWGIQGNGFEVGGSGTNSTLRITDWEGNEVLKITKGSARLAYLTSGSGVASGFDGGWMWYDMMCDAQPTGEFTVDLLDTFVEEGDGCPAEVREYADRGNGVWRCYFRARPGINATACFARFKVQVGTETTVEYGTAPTVPGLIVNGRKIAPVIPANAQIGDTVTWKVVQ